KAFTMAAGLAVLLFPALAAPSAAQQDSLGEVVDVNVVNVDVYVTDKSGRPVTDLRQEDFELREDGKRVEITNFEAVDRTAGAPAAGSAPAPAPRATGETAAPAAETGLHLVVYFDNWNIRFGNRARALQQLREFLTRQLVPGDQVMIASYDLGMNVRLPFTSDPAALSAALDLLGTLSVQGDEDERARRHAFQEIMTIQEVAVMNPEEPPCPQRIAGPAHAYARARRQEVQRTFSALTLLVNSLSGVPGRKAVLHVSDGIALSPGAEMFELLFQMCGAGGSTAGIGTSLNPEIASDATSMANTVYDSRMLGPDSYQAASQAHLDAQSYNVTGEIERLAAHANAHRVTLYTLDAAGAQVSAAADASLGPNERLLQFPAIGQVYRANRQDTLTALASATGGRAFLDAIDFLPELARMRQDFDRYYSLGYTPAHAGDGKEHRIEVKVKRPGLKARSRQSYRDKPALERTVDRTLAALLYNVEDNPLEVALEIGEPTAEAGGRYMVPVQLRIPLFKLGILNEQERYRGRLRLFVATRSAKGMTPLRQLEVPFEIPREQVLYAMGKYYSYTLSLQMAPGEQQIAVAVRDETTTTTSYLARTVNVGAVAAASQNR
ncbi:MAG TPA: VWA domain-containing protein, partial [Thermoanaerobaculia bacterium]